MCKVSDFQTHLKSIFSCTYTNIRILSPWPEFPYFIQKLCSLFHSKGNLISEGFSVLPQYPKKNAKADPLCTFSFVKSAQGSDLAPFCGDWSQSEFFSEIKQPLDD